MSTDDRDAVLSALNAIGDEHARLSLLASELQNDGPLIYCDPEAGGKTMFAGQLMSAEEIAAWNSRRQEQRKARWDAESRRIDDIRESVLRAPAERLLLAAELAKVDTSDNALDLLLGVPSLLRIPQELPELVEGSRAFVRQISRRIAAVTAVVTANAARGPNPRQKMTKNEANVRAREILADNPTITARALASLVPCSVGMISSLPAWKAVQERLSKKASSPRTGRLTDAVVRSTGVNDDPLRKLIAEQEADSEQSPLSDGKKRTFRRR